MTQPDSSTVYPVEIAATARAAQLAVRAQLLRQVVKAWPLLDPKRIDETFPAWLQIMATLIDSFRGQSSTAAARFYAAVRAHSLQEPTPADLSKLALPADPELIRKALGYAGPGMLTRDTARPNTALSTTLGTASRITLDAGRQTLINTTNADPAAIGWYRVTDGHPCAFCALLAARGVAYKHENTADFQAHNDCGCTAAPAFSRDQQLPQLNQTAAQIYRERGPGNALKAFRQAWADHQAQDA